MLPEIIRSLAERTYAFTPKNTPVSGKNRPYLFIGASSGQSNRPEKRKNRHSRIAPNYADIFPRYMIPCQGTLQDFSFAAPYAGMSSVSPAMIRSGLAMLLRRTSSSTVVLNCLAMEERVSPGLMTYVITPPER